MTGALTLPVPPLPTPTYAEKYQNTGTLPHQQPQFEASGLVRLAHEGIRYINIGFIIHREHTLAHEGMHYRSNRTIAGNTGIP